MYGATRIPNNTEINNTTRMYNTVHVSATTRPYIPHVAVARPSTRVASSGSRQRWIPPLIYARDAVNKPGWRAEDGAKRRMPPLVRKSRVVRTASVIITV
ncbi:hypothetical protein LSAT2_017085, partial [Lamellibrachia satsuma]